MTLARFALAALFATTLGGAAHAATCGGQAPAGADEFRGPVLQVLDSEHLCVALGADPASWVPVRLIDAPIKAATTPAARGALMAASFGQDVTCRIVGRDEAGVTAECRSDAGSVGRLSASTQMAEAGRNWR